MTKFDIMRIIIGKRIIEIIKTKKKELSQRDIASGYRMPVYNLVEGADRNYVEAEAKSIGIDPNYLRFNEPGKGTSYDPVDDVVDIKGDIFPRLTVAHPRAKMSVRAVLAHEFYGHRPNRAQYIWELENNVPFNSSEWEDEFRASYNASKAEIDLCADDRAYLRDDAITRAEEKQVYGDLGSLLKGLEKYEKIWMKRMRI